MISQNIIATKNHYPIKISVSRKEIFKCLSFILASFFFGTITLLIIINTPAINTPTELSQSRELKNYEIQIGLVNKKLEQLEMVLENIEERDNNVTEFYLKLTQSMMISFGLSVLTGMQILRV